MILPTVRIFTVFNEAVAEEMAYACDRAYICDSTCNYVVNPDLERRGFSLSCGCGFVSLPPCQPDQDACPSVPIVEDRDCVLGLPPNPDDSSCGEILTQSIEEAAQGGGSCLEPQTHTCIAGDGACPQNVDCVGSWSECQADCSDRVYSITTRVSGSGIDCPFAEGDTQACNAGEGACPQNVDCEGRWRCDTDCVPRFTQITARSGSGRDCPLAPTCTGGMDDCPRIVPGTVTSLKSHCLSKVLLSHYTRCM